MTQVLRDTARRTAMKVVARPESHGLAVVHDDQSISVSAIYSEALRNDHAGELGQGPDVGAAVVAEPQEVVNGLPYSADDHVAGEVVDHHFQRQDVDLLSI